MFAVVIFLSSKKIYKCRIKFGQMREYARRVNLGETPQAKSRHTCNIL